MKRILLTKEQYVALYTWIKENRPELSPTLKTPEGEDNYITNYELMLLLHVSRRTTLRMRTTGGLPYLKIGRKIYYNTKNLLNFFRVQPCNVLPGGHSPPPEDDGPDNEIEQMECLRCPLFVILNS
jgi:hypothetical protein